MNIYIWIYISGFPGASDDKESACSVRPGCDLCFRMIPWKRKWLPTSVFLPGEFPWTKELDGLQSIESQRVRHNGMNNISLVQSLSRVWLFVTPRITARQASLSITSSRSLLKLMFIESVMRFSHLILCRPLLLLPQFLPASGSFPMSQLFTSDVQSIGVSASASVLPMNTQDWSPLGWTCWISLQSKGPSRVFSNTTVQKHEFFGAQLSSQSNSHIHTWPLEKP